MARADDAAAMEAMMDMDFDMDATSDIDDDKTLKSAKGKKGDVVSSGIIKVKTEPGERKRRKVQKSEMVEENGYMGGYILIVGKPWLTVSHERRLGGRVIFRSIRY